MNKLLVSIVIMFLTSCTHIGTADKVAMMERWKDKQPSVALLFEVNEWVNWYHHKPLKNTCADQAEMKMAVLKELGIPCKRMHCIIETDPYNSSGHAFVLAKVNEKEYILDNGAVQDVVWEYEEVKKATWEVSGYEEWGVR